MVDLPVMAPSVVIDSSRICPASPYNTTPANNSACPRLSHGGVRAMDMRSMEEPHGQEDDQDSQSQPPSIQTRRGLPCNSFPE